MDWPYDETETPIAEPNAPEWECPEGICECHHPDDTGEKYELSVMLFSPEGVRMKGARCRVLHHGHVINDDQPYADGSGWVTAVAQHRPKTVLVEWAPADTPRGRPYPFRKWFYVDLDQAPREAARRRLHNLGYSRHGALSENVKEFQRHYGYERITGDFKDIEADLIEYHDEGCVPERRLTQGGGATPTEPNTHLTSPGDGGTKHFAPGGDDIVGGPPAAQDGQRGTKREPQSAASRPPKRGKRIVGTGSAMFPLAFPTAVEAIEKGDAYFEFVPIFVEAFSPDAIAQKRKSPDLACFFWIFGDALVWEVPNDDAWRNWKESHNPLPRNPRRRLGKPKNDRNKASEPPLASTINRQRLARLPCSATDSQAAADLIAMSQAELLELAPNNMAARYPPRPDDRGMASILPTKRLYDALYMQADVRIQYQYVDEMNKRSAEDMSSEYNKRVNGQIAAAVKKASRAEPIGSLGTPGKIWAAHEDMDRWQWSVDGAYWYRAAINYGFHEGWATPVAHQTPGSQHDTEHLDYSQILILVAGWCLVMGPDDKDYAWRQTAEVYTSSKYVPLVAQAGRPLSRYRYGSNTSLPPNSIGPHWEPEQR